MRSRTFWITWLTIVLALVLVYALLLVVAGSVAGSLFEWFGFGPDDAIGTPWALTFVSRALLSWFVLDTGMSLVLGYPTHALFNVPFAVALGIPLLRLRPAPA